MRFDFLKKDPVNEFIYSLTGVYRVLKFYCKYINLP